MKLLPLTCLVAAGLSLAGTAATAQEAPGATLSGNMSALGGPSLALALEAAQAAMAACKTHDYNVGVSVVDADGGIRVILGGDGALAADANGSRRLATLTAAEKLPGAEIVRRAKSDKDYQTHVNANRDWLAREGSVLLKKGDAVLGAIAVEGHSSGGHHADWDIACAQAGYDRIRARL